MVVRTRRILVPLLVAVAVVSVGCDGFGGSNDEADPNGQPQLSEQERKQLDGEVDDAKSGSHGLVLYRASYQNLNVAGFAGGKRFALVAGTHDPNFPFFGDRPWDDGELLIGNREFRFTHRTQGKALEIDLAMGKERGNGTLRYNGKMERVSDGQLVEVSLEIPVSFRRYGTKVLGWPLEFLDGEVAEKTAGMRWQPFELDASSGRVTIGNGSPIQLSGINGELEYGTLSNVQAPEFAFKYSYVNLAEPGSDGYAFVDFAAKALDDGTIGRVLDWYMQRTATATLTLDDGLTERNVYDVDRPAQSDPSVVLFESKVDLGLAVLKRQMIKTKDDDGDTLYGLREIFESKN